MMGKYNDGRPDQETNLVELQEKISKSSLPPIQKAYVILLYWLGCRRSEPLKILKEDIEEKDNKLFISIHYRKDKATGERILYSRAKRGQAGGPIELDLASYGLDIVKETWAKTKPTRKVFSFSDKTGYRAFKKLWPHRTPHWLRYNRVTKLRKRLGSDMTIDDIKSFTGIRRDTTIQNYGLKTKASIHKIAGMLE